MLRRAFGPARDTLLARDCFHYDAQQVASIAAILHHAFFDIFGIQSSALKKLTTEIGIEQLAAVAKASEVAKVQSERGEGGALLMINGKPPGGKQRVVQELGT